MFDISVQVPQMHAGLGRQDIDSLINTQNNIINSIREIRYVNMQLFTYCAIKLGRYLILILEAIICLQKL